MFLIQIFLPLNGNDGRPQPRELFRGVRDELTEVFGGVTTYSRAPVEGLWQDTRARRDDLVIHEVMAEALDRAWWRRYREELESRFQQQQILIRAQEIDVL